MNEDGLIPHTVSDYLDIGYMSREELAEKLPEFINDMPYTESCHYCGGFHEDSPHVGRAIPL